MEAARSTPTVPVFRIPRRDASSRPAASSISRRTSTSACAKKDCTPLSLVKKGEGRVVGRRRRSNFYPLRKLHRPLADLARSAIIHQLVEDVGGNDNSSI